MSEVRLYEVRKRVAYDVRVVEFLSSAVVVLEGVEDGRRTTERVSEVATWPIIRHGFGATVRHSVSGLTGTVLGSYLWLSPYIGEDRGAWYSVEWSDGFRCDCPESVLIFEDIDTKEGN